MIAVRPANQRGHTIIDWLDSYHTFSFDDYYDPKYTSFRTLRVINEDWVKPGAGFHPHPHRDMEIITYVLEGALEHKDSLGNGSVIRPGEVQRMSAGTGVTHSEFNHSKKEPVHLLQIWIVPEKKGIEPGYEQRTFPEGKRRGKLCLIAGKKGENGAVVIHQDVRVYASILDSKEEINYSMTPDRHSWIQVARGNVKLNGISLKAGDGVAVTDEKSLVFSSAKESEVLLFDLS